MVSSGDGAVVGVVRETRAINDDVLFVRIFSGRVGRIALPSCPQLDRTSKVLHVVQESVDPHGGCCVCEFRAYERKQDEELCVVMLSSGNTSGLGAALTLVHIWQA